MKYKLGDIVYTTIRGKDNLSYIGGNVIEIRLSAEEDLYKVHFSASSEYRETQENEIFESVSALKEWLVKEENKDHEERIRSIVGMKEYSGDN